MNQESDLKADLFCSLLISKKILSSMQIRRLMESLKIDSASDLYLNRSEVLTKQNLTTDQWEACSKFIESPANVRIDEYVEYVDKKGIYSMDFFDSLYPSYLRNLPNMPLVLYMKGDRRLLSEQSARVSIVGTRRPSSYGRRVTRDFSHELTLHDVVVVSGLARGIDGIAHMTCLETGGKTIAVLPCGLDMIYPPDHTDLFHEIASKGLLLSELPPSTKVIRQYFPARNRILSALSDCVLITEAGEKSGTLHTAAFAATQGREVFVVPTSVYSDTGKGNLELMKDGAQVATEPEDILAFLAGAIFFREIDEIKDEWKMKKLKEKIKKMPQKLEQDEVRLLISEVLMSQELSADEISMETELPYVMVVKELGKMEIEGIVVQEKQKYILTIRL
ncbi:MAG: DNA-processing protein DprA [Clostridiales bacterium]|nr:DNA-processing protein DprA [Clostridiales bacterium]